MSRIESPANEKKKTVTSLQMYLSLSSISGRMLILVLLRMKMPGKDWLSCKGQ